ncbi:MAG: biopolymer transporter ExbD [Gammaproteobacteria bacterium]|nr:biopolymer transporter ExbD [Gammaproteobacteria bacterium]MDH5800779.1 biopolymer transporter ExbD [Gammaproteobacteria bacterium]
MKMSRRAKRMERHHKRSKSKAVLNMVSLMDIFTILVFFLLVSSTTVQDLPNAKKIKLPESTAEKLPKETVVVMVSNEDIVVQGLKVADLKTVTRSDDPEIEGLKRELARLSKRVAMKKTPDGKPLPREVTIMGDRLIPYEVLKKIMYTCTKASYTNISLAVMRKSEDNG